MIVTKCGYSDDKLLSKQINCNKVLLKSLTYNLTEFLKDICNDCWNQNAQEL